MLRKGDVVKVEYEGTVDAVSTSQVTIIDPDRRPHYYKATLAETFTKIIPQVELGDMWRVPSTSEIFVVRKYDNQMNFYSITQPHRIYRSDFFFDEYQGAVLLYRLSSHGIKLPS